METVDSAACDVPLTGWGTDGVLRNARGGHLRPQCALTSLPQPGTLGSSAELVLFLGFLG